MKEFIREARQISPKEWAEGLTLFATMAAALVVLLLIA